MNADETVDSLVGQLEIYRMEPLPVGYRMPGSIKHHLDHAPSEAFCRGELSGWVKASCAVEYSASCTMHEADFEADFEAEWLRRYGSSDTSRASLNNLLESAAIKGCSLAGNGLASEVRAGLVLMMGLRSQNTSDKAYSCLALSCLLPLPLTAHNHVPPAAKTVATS
jgi:hypothetical protein